MNNKTRGLDAIQAIMYVEEITLEDIARRISKQGNMEQSIQKVLEEIERKGEEKESEK